jgi:hypothetical protein
MKHPLSKPVSARNRPTPGLDPGLARQVAEQLSDHDALEAHLRDVFSVDEKTQIQALDRRQPGLPLKKGRCDTMTHDYKQSVG